MILYYDAMLCYVMLYYLILSYFILSQFYFIVLYDICDFDSFHYLHSLSEVKKGMRIYEEEIFGPVLCCAPWLR